MNANNQEAPLPVTAAPLRPLLQRLERGAWLAALVLGVLAGVAAAKDYEHFLRSWLVGFLWIAAIPLGSLALTMLHALTGGSWGLAIRRLLEAATRTLPFLGLAFLPIALGLHHLYEWSHADAVAADPILRQKVRFLNPEFFWIRAAFYFALWIALAAGMNHLAAKSDRNPSESLARRRRAVAAPGLGLYALCATFASIDWAMSIEPHWYSTMYGLMFIVGHGLTTLAFAIVVASFLAAREPLKRWITADHFHDLGKLLFAFTMLWAYIAYSQYLIIWSANLAEETPWYLTRNHGGWKVVAQTLIAGHFALPFLALLSRTTKRKPRVLATIAAWLLAMRLVDLHWLITPAFLTESSGLHWMDAVVPLAMGAVWLALFVRLLRGRPLVSLQDAQLEGRLESGLPSAHGH